MTGLYRSYNGNGTYKSECTNGKPEWTYNYNNDVNSTWGEFRFLFFGEFSGGKKIDKFRSF